jgi:hypothetical protein
MPGLARQVVDQLPDALRIAAQLSVTWTVKRGTTVDTNDSTARDEARAWRRWWPGCFRPGTPPGPGLARDRQPAVKAAECAACGHRRP